MSCYEVSVEHRFTARHAVRRPDGAFEASHRHSWQVVATFRAERLDETTGMVIDFLTVRQVLGAVTDGLAGADLNAVTRSAATGATAERVAEFLGQALMRYLPEAADKLYRLAVSESAGCGAAWYPQAP